MARACKIHPARLEARRIPEEMRAQQLEEASKVVEVQPLTREQLAHRLELIKSRHQALIAQGKIKGGRRCSA